MTIADITKVAGVDPPDDLKLLKAWLIWKYEPNDNPGGKPRKVPYYVNGPRRFGMHGTADDRAALTTFSAARAAAAARGMDGVGFALLQGNDIVALDFDDCVHDGKVDPAVLELTVPFTYTELSPSGKGVRAFFRGSMGEFNDRKSKGFEVFAEKGYVTFTGNVLPAVKHLGQQNLVDAIPQCVHAFAASRLERRIELDDAGPKDPIGLTPDEIQRCLQALPDNLEYDEWVQVGMALHHELGAAGFEVWDAWSSRSPKYTTQQYGWERWRSFGKRSSGAEVTGRTLVALANQHGANVSVVRPASADDFEPVAGLRDSGEGADTTRFTVEPWEVFRGGEQLRWLIQDVLPDAELGVIYGAPGSGKSFLVLDMMVALAKGQPWFGHRVPRALRVVIVVAEGALGYRKRMAALEKQRGLQGADIPIGLVADAPNLLLLADTQDLVAGIQAAGGADVVVIDTLAQTTPGGDENSAQDMGKAISHCKRISRALGGAMVLLVHHSGKDASRGVRGWSGINAAADATIEVARLGQARFFRLSKEKDAADDKSFGFALGVVDLGEDEFGSKITSCAVTEAELPSVTSNGRTLGVVELIVNEVVQEFARDQTSGIEVEAVLKEAVARMVRPQDGKRDTRKQHARRALQRLSTADDAPYCLRDEATLDIV